MYFINVCDKRAKEITLMQFNFCDYEKCASHWRCGFDQLINSQLFVPTKKAWANYLKGKIIQKYSCNRSIFTVKSG